MNRPESSTKPGPDRYAYKRPGHLDLERSEEERLQFGRRLTKFIANNGYTQLDICRELGVGTDAVREWCLGRRIPKPTLLEGLARFMGKTPTWLLTGVDPKPAAPQRRLSDIPGLYRVTRTIPGSRPWTTPPVPGTRRSLERALGMGCPAGTQFRFVTVGALS